MAEGKECGARKQTDKWVSTGLLKGYYLVLVCRLDHRHSGWHHDTEEGERWP